MSALRLHLFLAAAAVCGAGVAKADRLGVFEDQNDIGRTSKAGSAVFEPASASYQVGGSGENMWFTNDAFHFVWKRVSGDFALQAAVSWLSEGGNAHRKACLMVRQSLSPDSPYVDVAVHGDGLVSLQFREAVGGTTHEIQARPPTGAGAGINAAATRASVLLSAALVGIERQGEVFFLTTPDSRGKAVAQGAFMRLGLSGPLYVGLAVCAHDERALETARFSQVQLQTQSAAGTNRVLHCTLETVPIASKDRRVVYHTLDHIEAPNWSRDGKELWFNSGGKIYRLPVSGGMPVWVDTGFADHCNNDHDLSPDGKLLAISDQSRGGKSLVYVLPSAGGTPRQLTALGPSYFHGWSPDGSTLAYCAERNGEFDVYTLPVAGGEEKRLTTAKGLDDGPDYSPDGRFIYFNSERTGTMQLWRMKPDGSAQEQITSDEFNNWFPHPSPDGKWLAFLSFEKDVKGHPANQAVRLRLMSTTGGPVQELARLFGGQGTFNVSSWSPDSRQVAFVSYELLAPED